MDLRLGYIILYVPDVPSTIDFYERAFALKRRFVHESGQYAELETGATALAFANETFVASHLEFTRNSPKNKPAGAEVGLVTADVGAAFDRAVAAGAISVEGPQTNPWGQVVSYVRDNNGFLIEICSPMG